MTYNKESYIHNTAIQKVQNPKTTITQDRGQIDKIGVLYVLYMCIVGSKPCRQG